MSCAALGCVGIRPCAAKATRVVDKLAVGWYNLSVNAVAAYGCARNILPPATGANVHKEVYKVAAKKYETVMVLSKKLGDEGAKEVVEKFKALIEANGTLESVDDWGKRRLAYPINYETEGYYTLFNFSAEPEFPAELDRIYKITEGVIRSLIVAKDE